jgi:pilus assembly protein CpaE
MTVLGVLGSKGGCGASLVATNLAVSLTEEGKTLLIDLHQELAYDDLLLDLSPVRSWADLMPVAQELTDQHLDLAFVTHSSGLKLLAAPEEHKEIRTPEVLPGLLRGLANRFDWVVVDLPSGIPSPMDRAMNQIELLLLVSTGDLPSIRNCKRTLQRLPEGLRKKTYLVMNQIGRGHPLEPQRIASALDLTLIATLPPDSHAVGYHVSYGTPSIFDTRSHFGRGIVELGQRVVGLLAGVQLEKVEGTHTESSQGNMQERKK